MDKTMSKAKHTLPIVVVGAFIMTLGIFLLAPMQADAKVTNKIDICHATSAEANPYTTQSVDKNATAGGHDDHLGGIFPANPWGDIIPTYDYQSWEVVGSHQECPTSNSAYTSHNSSKPCKKWLSGHWNYADYINIDDYDWVTLQFPGLNWTTDGQAIYNNNCVIPPVCGDGKVNQDSEQCDGEDGCSANCTWQPATISAKKIVCDNESSLPNWGTGGPDITASTAVNYVASHKDCHLADWTFQWAPDGTSNVDNNSGIAGGAWSAPFSSTVNVTAPVSKVWVREVWDSNYIPFSGDYTEPIDQDVSAEFYCSTDVLNYDNYDWIANLQPGQTYNCVGFNALATGSISGVKFNDLNGDGVWDKNEPTLPGWTINLTGDKNDSAITDANGYYEFTKLVPGSYSLNETSQKQWVQTKSPSNPITLKPGENLTDQNFGNFKKGRFEGKKFNDLNNNGVWDKPGEPALKDWTIKATKGDTVKTTTTDNDGEFVFGFLPNEVGTWTISEVQQDGWIQTFPNGGTYTYDAYSGSWINKQNFGNHEIICGDGFIQGTEVCDDGANNGQPGYCSETCTGPTEFCGDKIVQKNEQCDGNSQSCEINGYKGTQDCFMGSKDEKNSDQQLACTWNPCIPGEKCGDNVKNGDEQCDGTDGVGAHQNCLANCTIENVPYCGDGIKNGMEQCDKTDGITGSQTCSSECTIVNPTTAIILQLTKTVDKSLANPNDTLSYTITVKNTGTSDANNVVLTDTLPSGLTFLDDQGNNTGETTKTWTWTTIAAGASQTVTFKVHVDSAATAQAYINNASVKADGFNAITAQATTDVTIPKVLGAEAPTLTITKAVDATFVNPGGTANYTVVITNNGGSPAKNVILTDVLPAGFTFVDNGKAMNTWTLGDLVPTEIITKTYKVKVDSAVTAGKYINTATVKADNVSGVSAKATLEVRAVQVLGAEDILPVTGPRFMNYFYLIGAGLIGLFSLVVFKFTSSKE